MDLLPNIFIYYIADQLLYIKLTIKNESKTKKQTFPESFIFDDIFYCFRQFPRTLLYASIYLLNEKARFSKLNQQKQKLLSLIIFDLIFETKWPTNWILMQLYADSALLHSTTNF